MALVSLTTIAGICLLVIAFRHGFMVTILAAMCGTALGFVGTMAGIFTQIITAIDQASRALQ